MRWLSIVFGDVCGYVLWVMIVVYLASYGFN